MKKVTGILIGCCLIVCGVIYMLSVCGIMPMEVSLDGWWTLFIILPCLSGMLTSKDKIGHFIGFSVGVLLLLAARDVIPYAMIWQLMVPVIIVLLGIKMIMSAIGVKSKSEIEHRGEETEEQTAFLTETATDYDGKALRAAKIGAVFGGTKCNLTNADIQEDSRIDLLCVFGGAELIVPDNVDIKVNAFCLFGGISDKRALKNTEGEKITLNINGFCIFGGADIK